MFVLMRVCILVGCYASIHTVVREHHARPKASVAVPACLQAVVCLVTLFKSSIWQTIEEEAFRTELVGHRHMVGPTVTISAPAHQILNRTISPKLVQLSQVHMFSETHCHYASFKNRLKTEISAQHGQLTHRRFPCSSSTTPSIHPGSCSMALVAYPGQNIHCLLACLLIKIRTLNCRFMSIVALVRICFLRLSRGFLAVKSVHE